MTMADRIAVMDKGKVMQVATPAEIYEAPASRFIADFIGSVNMFEGTVESTRGGAPTSPAMAVSPSAPPMQVTRRAAAASPSRSGRRRSGVVEATGADRIHAWRAKIWDLAYLGDMTVYHVKLPRRAGVSRRAPSTPRASRDL